MIVPLLLAAVVSVVFEGGAPIDRNGLIQLIEASRPSFQDVSFEYEGEYIYPREPERKSQGLGPDGIAETYSGTYVRRGDGATLVDIYRFIHRTKDASHAVIATRSGTVESSSKKASSPEANINIRRAGIEEVGRGNFGSIWLSDVVLAYARSAYLYEYEGIRALDGHDCLVVRFRLTEDESLPKSKTVSKIFWIDLKRGGHVVHHEQRWGDDLATLTTGIRLESFEVAPGKSAWLPVAGHCEGRVAADPADVKKRVFTGDPIYVENYRLLATSLRWNQGLKDDRFSVKARPGDIVTDALRQAKYEFGQYMVRSKAEKPKPVSDVEVKKNLDRMLGDSDVLARELKASSPQRDGASWLDQWPWAVAGLAAVGLVVFVIRQRLAH